MGVREVLYDLFAQPQDFAQPANWALDFGLADLWIPSTSGGFDAVGGGQYTLETQLNTARNVGPLGVGISHAGGVNNNNLSVTPRWARTSNYTLVIALNPATLYGADYSTLLSYRNKASGNGCIALQVNSFVGGSPLGMYHGNDLHGAFSGLTTSDLSGQAGILIVEYSGTTLSAWWQGRLRSSTTFTTAPASITVDSLRLNNGRGDYSSMGGNVAGVAMFSRAVGAQVNSIVGASNNFGALFEEFSIFVPVAATGAQTLTPSLYTNTNTFYSPTVTTSTTLTPSLYTNNNVFYGPTVTATYALSPSLYTNTNTFYSPTVTVGTVTLTPSLYTNTNTFYSAVVSQGGVILQPSLYTNTNTFYNATITTGPVTLLPSLYANANTFYSPTVTVGAVTLTPSLYTNTNTFYSAVVSQGGAAQTLTPALYSNTNVFYSPTITVGTVTLLPALYTNTNVFYSPTVAFLSEFPLPSQVLAGVIYGPGGIYTGTLLTLPGETSIAIRSFTRKF